MQNSVHTKFIGTWIINCTVLVTRTDVRGWQDAQVSALTLQVFNILGLTSIWENNLLRIPSDSSLPVICLESNSETLTFPLQKYQRSQSLGAGPCACPGPSKY